MTRPIEEYELVAKLLHDGLNDCQVMRATGIPLATVRRWRVEGRSRHRELRLSECPRCGSGNLDGPAYGYLLGLYLGDGCLSHHPRGVFRLQVACDLKYRGIIDECAIAIDSVKRGRSKSGFAVKVGCVEVYSYWKHWPCLFPQHGPGPKHQRKIELAEWQSGLVEKYPDRLLRGLIQSDGWRGVNRVKGTDYPRYQFTNSSKDIRDIFCWTCDLYGVRWRQMNAKNISIAKAPDVALLDLAVGPKR